MKKLLVLLAILSLYGNLYAQAGRDYVRYVNPLIGTQKMGHTFPGATVPFGSVQLSPVDDAGHQVPADVVAAGRFSACHGAEQDAVVPYTQPPPGCTPRQRLDVEVSWLSRSCSRLARIRFRAALSRSPTSLAARALSSIAVT